MFKYWTPSQVWKDQTAYLIGGGSSLHNFDFSVLKGQNTIGANWAFILGHEVVKYLVFADVAWFNKSKWDLERFKGQIVTCAPALVEMNLPWIHKMERVASGIYTDHRIGWNYSSGAIMINLAVSLGAKDIYLLGYDLVRSPRGVSHWHDRYARISNNETFVRFQRGFDRVALDLRQSFPNVRVRNVTNGESNLTGFDKISLADFRQTLKPKMEMERIAA